MKINSKTSLKTIKAAMQSDFGIVITNEMAKEVKDGCLRGIALWTSEHYMAGWIDWHWLNRVTTSGVAHSPYKTFYTTKEWNAAVANNEL